MGKVNSSDEDGDVGFGDGGSDSLTASIVDASTGEVTIVAGATAGQTVEITATATVTEDSEYIYPEYRQSDSYIVTLLPSTAQGNRNNYTPGSW